MAARSSAGDSATIYYSSLEKYKNAENAWKSKMHDTAKKMLNLVRDKTHILLSRRDHRYTPLGSALYRAATCALNNYYRLRRFPKVEDFFEDRKRSF